MLIPLLLAARLASFSPVVHAWSVRPAAPERNSLLAGYAATLTAFGLRKPLLDDFQRSEATRRPLGRASRIGDYAGQVIPNALYAGGMWIAFSLGDERADHRAQNMAVATAEAGLTALALKLAFRERRPNGSDRSSFPSGHSTTIFSFATIVGAEHGWRYGVPAFALAAFTGWSRINDNMHYLHDVLAGATLGLSVGLGVYLENRAPAALALRVSPMLLEDGAGLVANVPW